MNQKVKNLLDDWLKKQQNKIAERALQDLQSYLDK